MRYSISYILLYASAFQLFEYTRFYRLIFHLNQSVRYCRIYLLKYLFYLDEDSFLNLIFEIFS